MISIILEKRIRLVVLNRHMLLKWFGSIAVFDSNITVADYMKYNKCKLHKNCFMGLSKQHKQFVARSNNIDIYLMA